MSINIYEVTYVNKDKQKKEIEEKRKDCGKDIFGISLMTYTYFTNEVSHVKFAANSFDEAYKKAKKYSKDEIKEIEFDEEVEI